MKKLTKITLSILTSSLLISSAFADSEQPVKAESINVVVADAQSNTADASYTIGYSIGKNMTEQLKQQNINLDTNHLQQGFITGIEDSTPKLSQETMEQAMKAFQKTIQAKVKAHEEAVQTETAKVEE